AADLEVERHDHAAIFEDELARQPELFAVAARPHPLAEASVPAVERVERPGRGSQAAAVERSGGLRLVARRDEEREGEEEPHRGSRRSRSAAASTGGTTSRNTSSIRISSPVGPRKVRTSKRPLPAEATTAT